MRGRDQTGFSIVELLITLAIVGTAIVLILGGYSTATRLSDRSNDLLIANQLAYSKLQKYENKDFEDINTTTNGTPIENFDSEVPTSLPGPREGKVYASAQSSTLKYIFVRVKYGQGVGQHTVEYGNFIQIGGLGR